MVGGDEVPARARPGRGEADVAAGVEARGDLGRARRAELGVEQREALGVGVGLGQRLARRPRPGAARGVRPALSRRCRRGGLDGRERDAEVGRGQLDRAVEQAVAGAQAGELAAARRRAGARVERDAREHVLGQARRRGRADGVARDARARQARGQRLAQVRAREAVGRALLAQRLGELADRLALHALGAGEPELAAEVDQHLVATRRHALEELVERLGRVELVEPHARLQRQHEFQRIPGIDGPIARILDDGRASGRVRPGGHRHRGGHLRSPSSSSRSSTTSRSRSACSSPRVRERESARGRSARPRAAGATSISAAVRAARAASRSSAPARRAGAPAGRRRRRRA